jgi:hypothetical protein
MASPIHQSIITQLINDIILSTATLPANLRQQTQLFFGEKFYSFRDQWSGSVKVPDLGLTVCNADKKKTELKWILEVGFSEQYKQLKDDAQLWLSSPQVSMVTIVGFCETPRYHCPLPICSETGEEELDPREVPGIPSDITAICSEDVILEGDYGPATYKGLRWAEPISEAWMETWVRDMHGEVIQRGNRVDLLHADRVELEFGDLLPPSYQPTITVNLERFRSALPYSIQEMAASRCQDALYDYLKRHGELQVDDPDYRP